MATESAETRQKPEVLVDTAALSEAEWLAWRRKGIGGSDAAAILGISPWRTARDLYDDKLGSKEIAVKLSISYKGAAAVYYRAVTKVKKYMGVTE